MLAGARQVLMQQERGMPDLPHVVVPEDQVRAIGRRSAGIHGHAVQPHRGLRLQFRPLLIERRAFTPPISLIKQGYP
jgi:hypothetical protein